MGLYNSEVWYGLSKKNIKKLEKVDEIFLRNLLNAHSKTSTEALYIETGTVPLRFIIQCRRLMYWKHLISIDKNRLISKIYKSQKNLPTNGDWIYSLMKDKEEFGIINTDEEIRKMSKNKFKKINKKKKKILKKNHKKKKKKKKKKS